MFKKFERTFSILSDEEKGGDWKLNDLKEIDERLSKFISEASAKPFEGTDFIKNYEDEKAAEKDSSKTDETEDNLDPYNGFGFGILEYFKLLQHLMYIYIVICILLIPVFYRYH